MTEYELTTLLLARSQQVANFLDLYATHLTIYLSIISAYLVTAYAVGATLTRSQAIIATSIFLVGCIYITLVMSGIMMAIDGSIRAAQLAQIEVATVRGRPPTSQMGDANPIIAYLAFAIQVTGIIASLYFMWSVRHRKDD